MKDGGGSLVRRLWQLTPSCVVLLRRQTLAGRARLHSQQPGPEVANSRVEMIDQPKVALEGKSFLLLWFRLERVFVQNVVRGICSTACRACLCFQPLQGVYKVGV